MTFRQVDDVIRGFVLSGYRNALSKLGKQQKNVICKNPFLDRDALPIFHAVMPFQLLELSAQGVDLLAQVADLLA